jgi:predicted HD phosphohydrolase
VGADPHKRDAYKDSPYFDDCVTFCERWDQSSFDPAYDTLPIDHFAERVRAVFDRKPYDPQVIQTGVRAPLVTA